MNRNVRVGKVITKTRSAMMDEKGKFWVKYSENKLQAIDGAWLEVPVGRYNHRELIAACNRAWKKDGYEALLHKGRFIARPIGSDLTGENVDDVVTKDLEAQARERAAAEAKEKEAKGS